ncbi:M81 family metallopeptidase [Mesorhizobium sp. B3-2-1]|nr:M81 family metallopeptidase [Mesorhizobium sp. B3-2-1]
MPSHEPGPKHRPRETQSDHRRILVGRFFHESHSFSPEITSSDRFEIKHGEDLIAHARLCEHRLRSRARCLGIDHPCDRLSPGKENGM